ncbi:MAG: glycine betaine ABC transporter substrate-binding protein [Raoultibacter sp.]
MQNHKTKAPTKSRSRLITLAALTLSLTLLGAVALTACSSNGQTSNGNAGSSDQSNAAPLEIATKPMTEQYILGEMLKALVEDAGYQANVTKGVGGGTNNIHPAMERGDFDLYPEYTSSGWVLVLGHKAGEVTDDEALEKLQAEYKEKYGMTWLGLYGFNNTYTVVVRDEIAKQYNLKNTSDLAAVAPELVFGGNPDYKTVSLH